VTKRFLFALAALAVFASPSRAGSWFSGTGPDYSVNAPNSFYCASTQTVTTQAGVSVSSPAIALYNPVGSGKNFVILDVGIDVTASPAAAAQFMLAYSTGVVPSTTTLNPNLFYGKITSAMVGRGGTSQATCQVFGTLPVTPFVVRYLGGTTGASAISGWTSLDQTQGKVVVSPGYVLSLQSSSAAAIQAHFLWREDPGN
jgi:hypothetical protein